MINRCECSRCVSNRKFSSEYQRKNKEKHNEYNRKYWKKNKEKIMERRRQLGIKTKYIPTENPLTKRERFGTSKKSMYQVEPQGTLVI